MAVRSETELYAPIKTYLERLGYEVKSEVNGCDIVAVRKDDPVPLIVEMKRVFNLSLLYQGIRRLQLSDHVYLAVERNRKKRGAQSQQWEDIALLCRMLGLGLLTVTFYKTKPPVIDIVCEPGSYAPRPSPRRMRRLLYEFNERSGDFNTGGSTRRKIVTSYREKALHCAVMLQRYGPLSPRKLRELTGVARVADMLQKNYYGWFERIERGIYRLTAAGEAALAEYSDVIQTKI
jgi:hypothetical protein